MLFNFSDRMLCQVLVYLGDNADLHVGWNATGKSANVLGGATTMRTLALLMRTICSMAAATVCANRCSSILCQSICSTALLRRGIEDSMTRPSRSLPCSCVIGLVSSKTSSASDGELKRRPRFAETRPFGRRRQISAHCGES